MILLTFLIILSILILVHELGHFLVAKKFGVKIEEFALGFPPKLWSKKVGETVYSLNAIPIGGYVKLWGEDGGVEKDKNKSFFLKSRLSRAGISIAGVVMNFMLAVLAFSLVLGIEGVPSDRVAVTSVAAASPAEASGFKVGDEILEAAGSKQPFGVLGFIGFIDKNRGRNVLFTVLRDGERVSISAVPRENPPESEGALGVSLESIQPPLWQRPFLAVYYGFVQAIELSKLTFVGIFSMVSGLVAGVPPKDIAGPIGIFKMTSEVAKYGGLSLVWWIGMLSVSLACINVLPFPALDGGRLLFIGIESLFGRRVVPVVEKYIHLAGFVILISLIILISIRDVGLLVSGKFPTLLEGPR